MTTEQDTKVIPIPQFEDCEFCDGTGMIRYSAKYIDGDLYHDSETMECKECGGSGKIKIQDNE